MVLSLDSNRDWTMVGAVNIGMDFGFFNTLYEFACDEEIINAPADVTVAGTGLHIPEGVGVFRLWVEMTEGIDVAGAYHLVYPRALLGEEAGICLHSFLGERGLSLRGRYSRRHRI